MFTYKVAKVARSYIISQLIESSSSQYFGFNFSWGLSLTFGSDADEVSHKIHLLVFHFQDSRRVLPKKKLNPSSSCLDQDAHEIISLLHSSSVYFKIFWSVALYVALYVAVPPTAEASGNLPMCLR